MCSSDLENLTDHDFYLFDVWNIEQQCYLSSLEMSDVVYDLESHGVNIKTVPYIGASYPLAVSLEQLIEKSDTKSLNHPIAEGIVYRALDGSTSFKVINNKFLLEDK